MQLYAHICNFKGRRKCFWSVVITRLSCMCTCSAMSNSLWLYNCSLAGSSVYGISQARILEWGAISCSRGSFWPKDRTSVSCISCIGKHILHCTTWEALIRLLTLTNFRWTSWNKVCSIHDKMLVNCLSRIMGKWEFIWLASFFPLLGLLKNFKHFQKKLKHK